MQHCHPGALVTCRNACIYDSLEIDLRCACFWQRTHLKESTSATVSVIIAMCANTVIDYRKFTAALTFLLATGHRAVADHVLVCLCVCVQSIFVRKMFQKVICGCLQNL